MKVKNRFLPDVIARAFVDARRTGAILPGFPGAIPDSLDAAYTIQDHAIALTGQRVGGWKVGRIAHNLTTASSTNRLAGPIFADRILETTTTNIPRVQILAGFAALEAELILRIAETPPADLPIDRARDFVDEVRFGLEVASSPFPGINDFGPEVTVSDFGNNFGLLLGSPIPDWRSRDLINAPVVLAIDDRTVGRATMATMLDGPFGALSFLVGNLARRGIALAPGTWVSTGAITGVHTIGAGQQALATFDGTFSVSCLTTDFVETALEQVSRL